MSPLAGLFGWGGVDGAGVARGGKEFVESVVASTELSRGKGICEVLLRQVDDMKAVLPGSS